MNDDKSEFLNLPEPKSSSKAKRALSSLAATTMGGRPRVKTESETRHVASPLNPASEFYLAFPGEIKTETKREDSDKAPSQTDEEEILKEVFKFQHEQIQQMITSQRQLATAISLPQPEIPNFNGDPMEFKTFVMAFDARIHSKVVSSADRLYYLDQHLVGQPKETIGGCLHIEPEEGYEEARKFLEKEYGDPYKVSTAYMQKLSNWPFIKHDDTPALKRFSLFLIKCKNAMKSLAHLTCRPSCRNCQQTCKRSGAKPQ